MNIEDLLAARDIMENSDGSEKRIGDFIIRHDFGANVYYEGSGGDVVIPEEVGNAHLFNTFENVTNITSLCIPGTVKSVCEMSFGSKATLQRLEIKEGFEEILDENFLSGCKELKEILLPASLKYMEAHAFRNTPWYRKNVEKVDGCHYLGHFLVDSDKKIERAVIREGTTMICGKAFKDRPSLREVIIPEGVQTIGAGAFQNCSELTTVHLPQSVQLVMYDSFSGAGLMRIEIENAEATISEDAFGRYPGVYPDYAYIPTAINGTPDQKKFFAYCYLTSRERFSPELQKINDAEVNKRKSWLLEAIMEKENVSALRNIAPIALSIKNIGKALEYQGSAELTAFLLSWKELHFRDYNPQAQLKKDINKDPLSATELRKVWNTKKLSDGSLGITSYKGSASDLIIPESIGKTAVSAVCRKAFSASITSPAARRDINNAIQTIYVPEGVTTIEFAAFEYCEKLENIYLPTSMTEIDRFAFLGCKNLTIHAPGGSCAEQYAKEHNIPFVAE